MTLKTTAKKIWGGATLQVHVLSHLYLGGGEHLIAKKMLKRCKFIRSPRKRLDVICMKMGKKVFFQRFCNIFSKSVCG